jgi:tetratricopeptide (TPR) repeat protein
VLAVGVAFVWLGEGILAVNPPQPTLAPANPSVPALDATALAFQADDNATLAAVKEEGLAQAVIQAASRLAQWTDFPDYLRLLESAERSYRKASPSELASAYEAQRSALEGSVDGVGWINLGLMALALDRPWDAEECFRQALLDPAFAQNPSLHAQLARALVANHKKDDAMAEFEEGSKLAEAAGDTTLAFRIRATETSDLFDHGYMDDAIYLRTACLDSAYPLERLWALSELIDYHWAKQEMVTVNTYAVQLKALLPTVTPRPDVKWEFNRLSYARKVRDRVTGALAGDPVKQMIMDEESLQCEYNVKRFDVVRDRLAPWVKAYPIEGYATWPAELQEWGSWVHWTYNCALCLTGGVPEAEAGFRSIIASVPIADWPNPVVNSWCWLGYCLLRQHKFAESVTAYEAGFTLDIKGKGSEPVTLPPDPDQLIAAGNVLKFDWRKGYVASYRSALAALNLVAGR